ncbi:hypothetical protein [Nocardioides sp.]|uniref:hypothetical protein n=1 Tax=Nocardioides sp. TaxID=35761 RepID=UPI0027340D76|nr:hypothetical protein [Nocardioides sp.]MDP3890500.1 hypothetical protein [Nocardioides sp.]
MVSVSRYGREMGSVFDLLGTHEPALTAALGWALGRSPELMSRFLNRLGLNGSSDVSDVAVQLETADEAGRTDIELFTSTAHVIIEAKQGWIVPGEVQLTAYAPRLDAAATSGLDTRLVTLSDSTAAWAHEVLPAEVSGVAVIHWSWDDVRDLIAEARSKVRGTERLWLDQLEDYMGAATSKRPVTDALAYCVVISNDLFGDATFRDYVVNQRVYFHPVTGGGWPTVPPNFLAFRWDNAVRQVNRVVDYEIVAHLSERFPSVADDHSAGSRPPGDAHVVYRLGPDIPLPDGGIPSGKQNLRAQRFWVLLDQLLTQPTVIEAREATKELGAT